eukprot:gene49876-61053_t
MKYKPHLDHDAAQSLASSIVEKVVKPTLRDLEAL